MGSTNDLEHAEERRGATAANVPVRSTIRKCHSDARPLWDAYFARSEAEQRNKLVEHYQSLVQKVVGHFAARLPRNVDRGDLEMGANVGLMAAIAAFDPARGVRFEAYAELRIRGSLLDELRAEDWLPRPWRRRVEFRKRTLEHLCSKLGRKPLGEEVADAMGLEFREYEFLFGLGLPDAPQGSMPKGQGREDFLPAIEGVPDSRVDLPGDELTRAELLRLVARKMTEQECRIVYLKYWEELPLREIGEIAGISESRVCKIHSRLMERLRDCFCTTAAEQIA